MTVLCGGGPSQLIPGKGQNIVFDSGLITEGLGIISAWLLPFALLIDAFNYEALTQCTNDPPAMPSSSDLSPLNAIGGILNPNIGTWLTAVNNLLLNWAWSVYCQCTSAPQPSFTFPPSPANTTIPTTSGGSGPCATGQLTTSPLGPSPSSRDMSPAFPTPQSTYYFSGIAKQAYVLPAATNPIEIDITYTVSGTFAAGETVFCSTFTLTSLGTPSVDGVVGSAVADNFTAPGTKVRKWGTGAGGASWPQPGWFGGYVQSSVSGSAVVVQVQVNVYCTAAPGIAQSCCPPDPAIGTALQVIQATLNQIFQSLPAAFNSFAESTVHSGLTGNGNAATGVAAVALKCELTTIPTSVGVESGDPTEYLDVGFITTSAVEGNYRSHRLEHTPQLFILGALVDAFHWSLQPGVVLKVTELVRGP